MSMTITKAQQGKILVAMACYICMFAFATEEPIYRVALFVLFIIVNFVGWAYE